VKYQSYLSKLKVSCARKFIGFFEGISSKLGNANYLKTLIDIQCSNSLIEAHNKVIKYNYLYKMTFNDDGQCLNKLHPWLE